MESTEAATAPSSSAIFHSKRTAALVPKESHPRGKRALRSAIQEFAEQFVNSLSQLLVDYCALRKSKTVDVNSLTRAAEDLLGEGAARLPRGVAKEDLPQTLIFSRFKRRLGGLRTEGACAELISIIGFNFLRYIQTTLDSVFEGQDAKAVEADAVIRALSQPRGFSKSGLPCIAYRPGVSTTVSVASVAKPSAAGGKKKKKAEVAGETGADKRAEAAEATEGQVASGAAQGGKPRKRKSDQAAPVAADQADQTEPAAKKKRSPSSKSQRQEQEQDFVKQQEQESAADSETKGKAKGKGKAKAAAKA